MRRVLALFLAVLFIAGIALAAETPGYRLSPGPGDIRGQGNRQSDPPKVFMMVRYVGTTSTLPADSIVIWDTTLDDGITVNTSTTSCDSAVAGIIVQPALTCDDATDTAVEDVGEKNWTWLQTYGLSQVNVWSSVAVKDSLGVGPSAGEASSCVANASTSSANGLVGFFYDAAAAGADDVECFLRVN